MVDLTLPGWVWARVWPRSLCAAWLVHLGTQNGGLGLGVARHGEGRRRFAGDLRSRSKGPDSGPIQLLRLLHGKAKLHKVQLGGTA